MSEFKCGFVGIVGPTNAGKSTLLNAILGEKVSIVSAKPQTTYHGIRGILNKEDFQLIFTDTPGFQNYQEGTARLLNKVADRNVAECDALVWVFDVSLSNVMKEIQSFENRIKNKGAANSICILNKTDLVPKPELLPLIQQVWALGYFSEIFPLSARKAQGVEDLVKLLVGKLPEGPALYDRDKVTDRSQDFRISELIREKIYTATRQEIPYAAYVEVEEWDPGELKSIPTVRAVIHVDTSSRKGIMIGKQGNILKKIGTQARQDIEKLVGKHICLKLHVDVEGNWREDATKVHQYLELV